jgi:hypothetical protein
LANLLKIEGFKLAVKCGFSCKKFLYHINCPSVAFPLKGVDLIRFSLSAFYSILHRRDGCRSSRGLARLQSRKAGAAEAGVVGVVGADAGAVLVGVMRAGGVWGMASVVGGKLWGMVRAVGGKF